MDTIKIQSWECLLHNKNSIYHHNHEQELFLRLAFSTDKEEFLDNYAVPSLRCKQFFYFYCNELLDPLHIKYKDYMYSLHPGMNRIIGKSILNDNFDPISCIVYSEVDRKLLPITGLEVKNKIEVIDCSKDEWETNDLMYNQDIIGRYSKNIDSHWKSSDEFWAEHTQDLYRIFFDDRHVLIFPNPKNLEYNKRIDVNIEDFSGFREALKYVYLKVLNGVKNDL